MAAETKAGTLRIIGEELEALRKRIIANHEAAGQVASGRTKRSEEHTSELQSPS